MSKYLELFKGSFNDSINEKTKPENKPYIGYSLTEGKMAYTVVPAKEEPVTLEAVDLGLPSGRLWANMNVGATSPEDPGLYFAWGDTVGYEEGHYFGPENYKWVDPNNFTKYTKYNDSDRRTQLLSVDDAATINMGSEWRMPTQEDFIELCNNTTITAVVADDNNNIYNLEFGSGDTYYYRQSSVPDIPDYIDSYNLKFIKGIKFTGVNNNSIILPPNICSNNYWGSDLSGGLPSAINFNGVVLTTLLSDFVGRSSGTTVRAVKA